MRRAFFREWPEDWPLILGGIAAETSFGEAEILAMTCDRVRFWWNAVAAYHRKVREESE